MIHGSSFRQIARQGSGTSLRTLVIASGTGMNVTVVPSDTVTLGILSEAGKIPINVLGPATPDYPPVVNQYLGLKRLATRIAEMIGCADRFGLQQYLPLLSDDSIRTALGRMARENEVWNTDDVAGLLSVNSIADVPRPDRVPRLSSLRSHVETGLMRAGQYIVDLAFQLRLFDQFERIVIPGHLSQSPQCELVWNGIQQRCRSYGISVIRLTSDMLAFDLGLRSEPDARTRLRSMDEFAQAMTATIQRYRLEGSQSDDFLPPSAAMELLMQVEGRATLEFTVGRVTFAMPVPVWAMDSEPWQLLAASTANALVTAGGVLGHASDFDSPERIFSRVSQATGSLLLAHQFNRMYVLGGHAILHLYKATFTECSGENGSRLVIPVRDILKRALNRNEQPDITGIDIGRSKIRAGVFRWNPEAKSWFALVEPIGTATPAGSGLAGITECVKGLVAQLTSAPGVIGVTWPGCVTQDGRVGGYSGIMGDATGTSPPQGVTTTTIERLREFDLAASLRGIYPDAEITAMNDLTAWGLGLWAVSSAAFNDEEASRMTDELLAPLGAGVLAWLVAASRAASSGRA